MLSYITRRVVYAIPIVVSVAAAFHFALVAPSIATEGSAFTFTIAAQDQFNNTFRGYSGTVHFSSSDSQAVLPADVRRGRYSRM